VLILLAALTATPHPGTKFILPPATGKFRLPTPGPGVGWPSGSLASCNSFSLLMACCCAVYLGSTRPGKEGMMEGNRIRMCCGATSKVSFSPLEEEGFGIYPSSPGPRMGVPFTWRLYASNDSGDRSKGWRNTRCWRYEKAGLMEEAVTGRIARSLGSTYIKPIEAPTMIQVDKDGL